MVTNSSFCLDILYQILGKFSFFEKLEKLRNLSQATVLQEKTVKDCFKFFLVDPLLPSVFFEINVFKKVKKIDD